MQSVDVEKIDRPGWKLVRSLIKSHSLKRGEVAVVRRIPGFDFAEHLLAIEARVLVADPAINGESLGVEGK